MEIFNLTYNECDSMDYIFDEITVYNRLQSNNTFSELKRGSNSKQSMAAIENFKYISCKQSKQILKDVLKSKKELKIYPQ